MKNIYIFPTIASKSFGFCKRKDNGVFLLFPSSEDDHNQAEYQHIYITSDEKIKGGDWCLLDHNVGLSTGYSVLKCLIADVENGEYLFKDEKGDKFTTGRCDKIILSTDLDLIKDGVQAIPDDFLEWFVKNPSCEKVEVKIKCQICHSDDDECWRSKECGRIDKYDLIFKIIIPKDETEHLLSTETNRMRLLGDESTDKYIDRHIVKAMVEVSKEKMYSEDEVFQIMKDWDNYQWNEDSFNGKDRLNFKDWFTKFKKK